MASKVIQTVRAHVPLIRFRKGGVIAEAAAAATSSSSSSTTTTTATSSSSSLSSGAPSLSSSVLDWWELPPRFRRRPIDDLECDVINMGGREQPFQ